MKLFAFIAAIISLISVSCSQSVYYANSNGVDRAESDSLVKVTQGLDSLLRLYDEFNRTGNRYGAVVCGEAVGKLYREEADFDKALEYHKRGLEVSVSLNDTLLMSQVLNNLGTCYRRIGSMQEASDYHFKALNLLENLNDTSYRARKYRLIALNGIGNIYLTMGNMEAAERAFRRSMAGEKELGSYLGQAINAANIGATFESRKMYDSAYVYYLASLEFNRKANSNIGLSLCYNHLGQLDETNGNFNEALKNYLIAYRIMENDKDRWHWLESCISTARVYIKMGDYAKAAVYLERAKNTAESVKSIEHLSTIYNLYSDYYKGRGDYRSALDSYAKSIDCRDSVYNRENLNHLQNKRVDHERTVASKEIDSFRNSYMQERRVKRIILAVCAIIMVIIVLSGLSMWYAQRMKLRSYMALKQLDKMRTTFFTNITHEFRTPLTVILGLIEQMRGRPSMTDDDAKSLGAMERQGRSLLSLVNQLLDMQSVISHTNVKQWKRGNMVTYLKVLVEPYNEYAVSKQIKLSLESDVNDIETDFVPQYYEHIMRNLLSNAFKFTPVGGVIKIGAKTDGEELVLSVFNNGKNILSEDLPHVFETFYQGSDNGNMGGTGIGLAYVSQMVKEMNGTITVKNLKGEGVVFTIRVPLHQVGVEVTAWSCKAEEGDLSVCGGERDGLLGSKESLSNVDDNRPSLLIVEDNADVSYYIGTVLGDRYRLSFAQNGKEGLELAGQIMPDLIITDVMMPVMDGYELCKEIKTSEILNHIPVVIVTAKGQVTDRIKGYEEGADAYLSKPFSADEMLVIVAKLLEQRRVLREKFSSAIINGDISAATVCKENEKGEAEKRFVDKVTKMVEENITNPNLNADILCEMLFMSRSQLDRKMKAVTGFTCTNFIIQVRMERAKRMLLNSDEPIGDIAYKCGYMDTSYFSRVFKQVFGVTPSQMRKR